MVRPATLKLALLGSVVLAGHLLALEWVGRQADKISGLVQWVPPMYTRMLKPATPPPVPVAVVDVAQPKPRAAPAPRPPASSPEELRRKREADRQRKEAEALARKQAEEEDERRQAEAEAEALRQAEAEAQARAEAEARVQREQELAQAAAAAASAASAAAPAASAAAAAASDAKSEAASLDAWPVDTRITYRLDGHFRSGPLFGDARVQWQREQARYQVRLEVKIQVFGTQVLTSQGEVTPQGLLPRAYEELRPGKRRFAQIGDEVVVLENGKTLPRPAGVQDTASQFVELAHRFATGREAMQVGRSVHVWLARPGGVDQWVYDIVGREMLQTPRLGTIEAFHLKPRPIAHPRGNYTAEMWFAPSLQYLPVKIRVMMGNEAQLDLTVDHIEQR